MKHLSDKIVIAVLSAYILGWVAVLAVVGQSAAPPKPIAPKSAAAPAEREPDGKAVALLGGVKVIDADTLSGTVTMIAVEGEQLLWGVESDVRPLTVYLVNQRIRLHGVDAWELRDKPRGPAAKEAVEDLLKGDEGYVIWLTPRGKDNFGRLLADVMISTADGREIDLAKWLIEHGHGVPYKPPRATKDR